MQLKHWLSLAAAAFVGGAATYALKVLGQGQSLALQVVEAAALAGVIGAAHLFQTWPPGGAS